MESCELYNAGYKITEIAEKYKIHTATIREYLKRGTELKLCTYIPYKDSQGNGSKKVICLNTREVYESIRSASIDKNIDEIHISECCRHKTMTCSSKDKKYNNLIWLYYDEYQELINNFVSIEDYISECLRIKYSKKNTKVICLETGIIYKSITNASKLTNICRGDISRCCLHQIKTANGYHWQYYKDELNLEENRKRLIDKIGYGRGKKIICVETGKIYNSIKDASLDINIDNSSIGKVVKGVQETAGGYHWKIA